MSEHIFHYNTNSEQRYFLDSLLNLYDTVALNGNIVSHTPQGVASFIARTAKPFYIDPQTHIFQHPTINLKRNIADKSKGEKDNFEFKPSIQKLAKERLRGIFAEVINRDRPINPTDFFNSRGEVDKSKILPLCESIIFFQSNFLASEIDDESKEFIDGTFSLAPKFIIAPYFYLAPKTFFDWFRIMIECFKLVKEIEHDKEIFIELVLSPDVMEQNGHHITEELAKIKPDGILLWIDAFKEEDLSTKDIMSFIQFLKGIRNTSKSIYNIHGGYLSLVLCHEEKGILNGIGHCANYGESRPVIPVGGGIPMARFYFPSVHSRLRFGDALLIVKSTNWLNSGESYLKNLCKCAQCRKIIKSNNGSAEATFAAYGESYTIDIKRSGSIVQLEYPEKEAKNAATLHYLYNKHLEFNNVRDKTYNELVKDIGDSYNKLYEHSDYKMILHLNRWLEALSSI